MLNAIRQPDLPAPQLWFMLSVVLSLLAHILLVAQFDFTTRPILVKPVERLVIQVPAEPMPSAEPARVTSAPPLPVRTLPEVLGTKAQSDTSIEPAAPTAAPFDDDRNAPDTQPEAPNVAELRAQLREQTRIDGQAEPLPSGPFALKARPVWRDSGQDRLPGTVGADNTFTGRMHEITDISGIKSEENFTDSSGIDYKVIKLKNGKTLCGERMPEPVFEHFAEYIFTWRQC